ncbi:MAG: pyridoxal-phosphate dependent enzyme [Bacteroidetes bacterium]|nr:pyridoxal-phosphate dependent enzyme [Bacteroidota bacterium]
MNYPSVIEQLRKKEYISRDLHVDVLRLDKLHPIVSGNKWFKLEGHLRQTPLTPGSAIITFGGAWSNHIVATAYTAQELGLRSIGIIRGERPSQLSVTLKDAITYGMTLNFVSRKEYSQKDQPAFLQHLAANYPGAYIIPEGGSGEAGIVGCSEILRHIDSKSYTHILCAIGTGTTFLGILRASTPGQEIIGIPVLKGISSLKDIDGDKFLTPQRSARGRIIPDYHFGGYARHPQQLLDFMNRFYHETGIPSDIVYTGKLFYALEDSISRELYPSHSRLLVIHSGGLQGNRSLSPGQLDF